MNENYFFAEDIVFEYPGEKIGEEEIDELDDFPGKEDFINFYMAHNGGTFIYGARFIPEDCYNFSKDNQEYIVLDYFLGMPVGESDGLNIEVMKDRVSEKHPAFEDFVLFHIPFAVDVTNNPFWIDIQTGEIKYIDFEESQNPFKMNQNPDDVITVAFCFKDFCKCIRKHIL